MTVLTTKARDRSTYIVTAAFTDKAGASVIPDSITWTLTDAAGTIINSREAVAVAVPAASIDIVLSGADLDYDDGRARVLLIEAVYDSDEGDNLPSKEECYFEVTDLLAV
jgi:hypothetical protein